MAKLIIKKNSQVFVITDVSVPEIKMLVGLDESTPDEVHTITVDGSSTNFRSMLRKLDARQRNFLHLIKQAGSNGITSDELVPALNLSEKVELGAIAGGGVGRAARHCALNPDDIYQKHVRIDRSGIRTVLWKPGKLLQHMP